MESSEAAMAPGVLVIGAAGSGKSAYAERVCVEFADRVPGRPYYLATMPADGAEARKRIERHRKLRSGKGFETLELPRLCADTTDAMLAQAKGCAALLECMGTLAANELFGDAAGIGGARGGSMDDARMERILGNAAWRLYVRAADELGGFRAACLRRCLAGAALWLEAAGEVVMVTNDVFADDGAYDEDMLGYRAVLGAANRVLARRCARVVEVVCGIPVAIKGDLR